MRSTAMRRLALLLLALAATAYKDPDDFVVAGYLPEWRYEGAHWESLATHLTHLIFFSPITSRGSLQISF